MAPHYSLQCGGMPPRVTVAWMLPCGSLVATYTSSSNCAPGLCTSKLLERAHDTAGQALYSLVSDNVPRGHWSCCRRFVHCRLSYIRTCCPGRCGRKGDVVGKGTAHLAGDWTAGQEVQVGHVKEDGVRLWYPARAAAQASHHLGKHAGRPRPTDPWHSWQDWPRAHLPSKHSRPKWATRLSIACPRLRLWTTVWP